MKWELKRKPVSKRKRKQPEICESHLLRRTVTSTFDKNEQCQYIRYLAREVAYVSAIILPEIALCDNAKLRWCTAWCHVIAPSSLCDVSVNAVQRSLQCLTPGVHPITNHAVHAVILSNEHEACLISRIFTIKSRSHRKKSNVHSFWPSIFSRRITHNFYGRLLERFAFYRFTMLGWVPFRLLTSVCEAWQWSTMQNLRKVG